MQCPSCSAGESDIINSRQRDHVVRRRRKCAACGHRWSTIERAVVETCRIPISDVHHRALVERFGHRYSHIIERDIKRALETK